MNSITVPAGDQGKVTKVLNFTKVNPSAIIPTLAKEGDAGFDLSYCGEKSITIPPGVTKILDTGICAAIPIGVVGMVCPRSGLAAKNNVTVLNAPGIIDSGYRGEIKVILTNQSDATAFEVLPGMRIAQLVLTPVVSHEYSFIEVDSLDETARGQGGLGSTGL